MTVRSRLQLGIHPLFCASDAEANTMRALSSVQGRMSAQMFTILEHTVQTAVIATTTVQTARLKCYTLKLFHCKLCGTTLFGEERYGVCCWKQSSGGWCVSFRRLHSEESLKDLYEWPTFIIHSVPIDAPFASVRPIMCLQFGQGDRPSFHKIYGNVPLVVLLKDSTNTFLCSDNEPSLPSRDQQSRLLVDAGPNPNVSYMVPILSHHLKTPAIVVRNWY